MTETTPDAAGSIIPELSGRRLWWLAVYDPTTGLATRVVGVLGVQGTRRYVSWVPYELAADFWKRRLAVDEAPVGAVVDAWAQACDGISWALLPISSLPASPDLAGTVEAALDAVLAAGD